MKRNKKAHALKRVVEKGVPKALIERLDPAQELVYDGWEILAFDAREAKKCFSQAIALDPGMADAYNGLAEVALAKGDMAAAEKHYLTAYEKAKASLGTEAKNAFSWWGELETRPYMRSRHGLGLLYLTTGRYEQAIALFEDLLARNPNDNQGVRYLVAPTHLLKDGLPGALEAFDWFARHYAEDIPDPHFLLNWGLASYMAGRFEDAAMRFRSAFFANPYLLPLVLGRKPKVLPIWHSDNLMRIDYAREYFDWFGGLWSDRDDARGFVGFVWDDVEIRAGFRRWKDLWTEIDRIEVSDLRSSLIDKAREIETSELSRRFFLRMKTFLDSLVRPF